jgi:hypothetical protein
MEFRDQIKFWEGRGYRWITMGAVRVLMTNGDKWLVGAKYDGDFDQYDNHDDAAERYRRIANPYCEEAAQ